MSYRRLADRYLPKHPVWRFVAGYALLWLIYWLEAAFLWLGGWLSPYMPQWMK